MACATSRKSAISLSNASTWGPKQKALLAKTSSKSRKASREISRHWMARSLKGMRSKAGGLAELVSLFILGSPCVPYCFGDGGREHRRESALDFRSRSHNQAHRE